MVKSDATVEQPCERPTQSEFVGWVSAKRSQSDLASASAAACWIVARPSMAYAAAQSHAFPLRQERGYPRPRGRRAGRVGDAEAPWSGRLVVNGWRCSVVGRNTACSPASRVDSTEVYVSFVLRTSNTLPGPRICCEWPSLLAHHAARLEIRAASVRRSGRYIGNRCDLHSVQNSFRCHVPFQLGKLGTVVEDRAAPFGNRDGDGQ